MPQEAKRYILQFDYVDNGQLYEDLLLLTDLEAAQLHKALQVLFDAEHIRSVDSDPNSDSLLTEYRDPEFQTLHELKDRWENGDLGSRLRDEDFEWEGAA